METQKKVLTFVGHYPVFEVSSVGRTCSVCSAAEKISLFSCHYRSDGAGLYAINVHGSLIPRSVVEVLLKGRIS
jgi:hypothetical protein